MIDTWRSIVFSGIRGRKVQTGEFKRVHQVAEDSLCLEPADCCLCGSKASMPIGVGEDFEYRTSADSFLARRCERCSLVYLDPRPALSEFARIYPPSYHAFAFDAAHFGIVHRVRERLEAWRLLRATRGLDSGATILDVGCGDGFHLDLIRRYGRPGWKAVGVDLDPRAVQRARSRGLDVVLGRLDQAGIADGSVDLALCIQTIEHVDDPPALLRTIRRLLKPNGRLLIVTDNTGSLDFRLFSGRHWGGYHFPRHWNLFDRTSMARLAKLTGYDVESLQTMTSPVNWTYSVRNLLDDWGAPRWLVNRFTLQSPITLAVATLWDMLHRLLGRGALLCVTLARSG
jgi:SAM-dependent methyltransferase